MSYHVTANIKEDFFTVITCPLKCSRQWNMSWTAIWEPLGQGNWLDYSGDGDDGSDSDR